jgi:hypothetical protein
MEDQEQRKKDSRYSWLLKLARVCAVSGRRREPQLQSPQAVNQPGQLELSSGACTRQSRKPDAGEYLQEVLFNLPIDFIPDPVQILPALLAEIFVRTRLLVHDTHTATVLPHLTGVALNEHTPNVVGQHVG